MLSQNQLIDLIYLLKESLNLFDRQSSKIVFFNDWSLYRHIREFNNIGEILDTLEPYIPFRLTEENFDLFMESVFVEINPQFAHKAKLDFVMFLRGIKNPTEWEQTIAVCEAIRAVKGELVGL